MAQEDYTIDNASGATVRADINSTLSAIVSQNSGASAPSTTFAYMYWADTTNGVLKRRNAANSGWIIVGPLASTMVQAKSADYTVVAGDFGTLIDVTSGSPTISLTAAATLADGFVFGIRNSGTGLVTIDPNSSETIDGSTTITLGPGQACVVWCSGTAFKTVGLARGWALINTQAASSSATVDFTTGLDDNFDQYEIRFDGVLPATSGVNLVIKIGTGAGPTWNAGASDYSYAARALKPAGTADVVDDASSGIVITGAVITNNTSLPLSGVIRFANPDGTGQHPIFFETTGFDSAAGALVGSVGVGAYLTAGAMTGLRFLMSSGNIASGNFRLYGLRK